MSENENTRTRWDIQYHSEVMAVLLSIFTISQIIALISFQAETPSSNILGLFGHVTAALWFILFGPISFLGMIGLTFLSYCLYIKEFAVFTMKRMASLVVGLFSLSLLLVLVQRHVPSLEPMWQQWLNVSKDYAWLFTLGGLPMEVLYDGLPLINFSNLFNVIGTALIASTGLFLSLMGFFNISMSCLLSFFKEQKPETKPVPRVREKKPAEPPMKRVDLDSIATSIHIATPSQAEEIKRPSKKILPEAISVPCLSSYPLPNMELLRPPKESNVADLTNELKEKAKLLEDTLLSFGIEAKVGEIHCGPRITLFEVHPAVGVKVGRIKTLEHDIALNMQAKSIRIIAPIPGKAAVGIEIPNQKPQEVSFCELLTTYKKQNSSVKIPMILGKAVNGDPVITDLTKMPHCIIAGATGSGKSVCINSIIMSILMLAKPEEIRLLMIDPKKVELTPYTELPHMLAPVITDTESAQQALSWLVREMEIRYEILKTTGQRNIESFNKRIQNKELEKSTSLPIPDKMFYIVGIVDELADLMMSATQDIETPITRIAQMARAVGIHLILATQRPSREVITGLIKANFPSRISFKVASRINSQIVLDDVGADTLLGNGDMLILLPGMSHVIRAQGSFVHDDEIQAVVQYIQQKAPPNYLIRSFQRVEKEGSSDDVATDFDPLFEEAKQTVLSTGNASTTFLQRKLKIGYARAASIMDHLEAHGIIGPQEGAKPRKIFYPKGSQFPLEKENLQDSLADEEFPSS